MYQEKNKKITKDKILIFFIYFSFLLSNMKRNTCVPKLLTFQAVNQVVLWDKIIKRGDNAKLDYRSMNTKYYFWDDGNGLRYVYLIHKIFITFVLHVLSYEAPVLSTFLDFSLQLEDCLCPFQY